MMDRGLILNLNTLSGPERVRIMALGGQGLDGLGHPGAILAVGDAEPTVGSVKDLYALPSGSNDGIDHGGNEELSGWAVGGVPQEQGELFVQQFKNRRMKSPHV